MAKGIDLTGKRFGRLMVIKRVGTKHNQCLWECLCDCGKSIDVIGHNLRIGCTKSCGCLRLELLKNSKTKHGYYGTRIYRIYTHMKARCYNSHIPNFERYGGRGIKICDEWLGDNGFENFCRWAMSNGYDDSLSIDRIDNDGNYEPSNCRWADLETQANNKSNSCLITFNGETRTMQEWANITGIKRGTIESRINQHGWTVEKALTIKPIQICEG